MAPAHVFTTAEHGNLAITPPSRSGTRFPTSISPLRDQPREQESSIVKT